jgi:hypothetical protein
VIHVLDFAIDHRSDLQKPTSKSALRVLYVLGTIDRTFFRIGVTSRPISDRMREHADYGPKAIEMVFLTAVPAVHSDESAVHNYFKQDRAADGSEWFHYAPEIENWVRWLKHRTFALNTTEQADNLELRAKARAHVTPWLPGPKHQMELFADGCLSLVLSDWGDLVGEPPITGDDYYTPEHIIEAARRAMGGIDTDPATHYAANRRYIRAPYAYTLQVDGLKHPWYGHVWCNPPFNQWDEWVPKILAERKESRVADVCVLLPCRAMSRRAVGDLLAAADALWISRGRLQFWGDKATGSPDDGSVIAYFGPRIQGFIEEFSPYGPVKVAHTLEGNP